MKTPRTIGLLLAAMLLLSVSWYALGETDQAANEAIYEAKTLKEFHLRAEPEAAYRVIKVPKDTKVKIYGQQDGWYLVHYKNEKGWAKEDWLWAFRSLDAARYPVPGFQAEAGVITVTETQWITGGKLKGVDAAPGSVLTVYEATEESYLLRVWRGETSLDRSAGEWTPFTPWQDAQPGDLISGFTTYYYARQGAPLQAERQHNIALGCRLIDGTVVQPGESFSFNALCGPYSQRKGYKVAPNISEAGTGWGGGVCQVTTSLYNAVLGLPLQITEWAPHQKSGVVYVPVSRDAAVGSTSNFSFINTLDYPIRIWAQPQNGVVTVLIYRAEEEQTAE